MNFIKNMFFVLLCPLFMNSNLQAMDAAEDLSGTYIIRSRAPAPKQPLEACPLSKKVCISNSVNPRDIIWNVVRTIDGYYTISCDTYACGHRYLEACPSSRTVQLTKQYPPSETHHNNQKWVITTAGLEPYITVANKFKDVVKEMNANGEVSKNVVCNTTRMLEIWQNNLYTNRVCRIMNYDQTKCLKPLNTQNWGVYIQSDVGLLDCPLDEAKEWTLELYEQPKDEDH